METRKRDELLERYRLLRKINVRHQSAALDLVSESALIAQARKLGLAQGKQIVADDPELAFIFDLAVYTASAGRTRAIDRYARTHKPTARTDDFFLLDAMRAAKFSLWQVVGRHEAAGLHVRDLVRDETVWLIDESLEKTAPHGMTIATRAFQTPDGFTMACGVAVTVDDLIVEAMFELCEALSTREASDVANDRRFATALYRLTIEDTFENMDLDAA